MKSKNFNKKNVTIIIIVLLLSVSFAYADSWTSSQPSHGTLYADTITSKTDSSSVNIADSQGLFVTGDITTLGKVGIGTTGPGNTLEVRGVISSTADNTANRRNIYLEHTGTTANVVSSYWGTNTYTPLAFHTGGGEKVRIDTAGNVGIGTTTPGTLLNLYAASGPDVKIGAAVGVGSNVGRLRFENSGTITSDIVGGIETNTASGNLLFFTTDTGTRSEKLRITPSGNVGIGTTGPGQKLHIQDATSYTAINVYNQKGSAGGTSALQLGLSDGTFVTADASRIEARVTSNPNSALDFKVYGSGLNTIMTLLGTGNVGIGTTNPANDKLHVFGRVLIDDSYLRFSDLGTTLTTGASIVNGASGPLMFGTGGLADGNERMRIDSNGNVGIGTTGPGALLHLNSNSDTVLRIESTSVTDGQIARLWTFVPAGSADSRVLQIRGHSGATFKGGFNVNKDGSTLIFNDNSVGITVASGSAGNVGIGTTTPARKLHISDAMRLQPIASPPSSPSSGDLYFDNSDALCVYVTAGWSKIAGAGACT